MKATFERWLKRQFDRDDIIGDLARDFIFSNKTRRKQEKCDEYHLSSWRACREAYEALKEAKQEYAQFLKQIKSL